MKKNIHLFSFMLLAMFAVQANAQLSFNADTLYSEVADGIPDIVIHNEVTSSANATATFRWVRKEVVIPDGWTSAVCDINLCYLSSVDSIQFDLPPATPGRMDVHLYPTMTWDGNALIEVTVKDVADPSINATAVYVYDSELTSTREVQQIQFKVFPNPTSGLFAIEGETEKVAFLTVFSTLGQRLIHLPVQGGNWYDVANLSAGTYLVQLSAEDGRPLGSKLISKF